MSGGENTRESRSDLGPGVFDAWSVPGGAPTPADLSTSPLPEHPAGTAVLRWPEVNEEEADRLLELLVSAPVPSADVVLNASDRVAGRLLDPSDPLRREALDLLPTHAGLSGPAAEQVLDRMASDWRKERLGPLLEREFGPDSVHEFGSSVLDPDGRAVRFARSAPRLLLTICSGTVPGVSVSALLRGLLVGSAVLVKPGAGDAVLPVLFARALREVSPELGARTAVVYWPGGKGALEARALARADRIVVYGGGEAIASVRSRASTSARLVEYRHRIGVAVVKSTGGMEVAEALVDAVVPYEQRGCVSPARVMAVGEVDEVRHFANLVAEALTRRAQSVPPLRSSREAATARAIAETAELRKASGADVHLVRTEAGTVIVDESGPPAAGGRVVGIERLAEVGEVGDALRRFRGIVQSVGLAGFDDRAEAVIAEAATRIGASRVGPLGEMAWPPPWWTHEGEGPLNALVDRVEWVRASK